MQEEFMKMAAVEAESNVQTGEGGPFGAVIVKDGKVIAKAHNEVLKQQDATCHAEILAIRQASKVLGTFDLSGCELYTNCYPCPMCLAAIIWANIKTVYYGNTAVDADAIGFRDDFIYDYILKGMQDKKILQLQPLARDMTLVAFKEFKARRGSAEY